MTEREGRGEEEWGRGGCLMQAGRERRGCGGKEDNGGMRGTREERVEQMRQDKRKVWEG